MPYDLLSHFPHNCSRTYYTVCLILDKKTIMSNIKVWEFKYTLLKFLFLLPKTKHFSYSNIFHINYLRHFRISTFEKKYCFVTSYPLLTLRVARPVTLKYSFSGFPWWSTGWEATYQCRRHEFDHWSRKIPHAAGQLIPCTTMTEAPTA